MSTMVRAPKTVAAEYWHRPWSAVVAACERSADGLVESRPRWTPWRRDAPKPEQYKNASGDVDTARYEKDALAWREEQDVCFLYEGDRAWPSDKTLLFQQNW